MRLGKYEFGLIKPLDWYEYEKSNPECGCTIYTFGFWYFTILSKECNE